MSLNSTVSEHTVIQFSADVHRRVQQKTSRLQPYVKMQKLTGKYAAYDGTGIVELAPLEGRYKAIEFTEMEHWRRKISKARFGATLPIDEQDIEERLKDPESGYAEALANAAVRQFDRVVVGAMFADVSTGEDFTSTLTFAQDGGLTVDATGGLTYEKLLEIGQNFIDNDVTTDMDRTLVMGITGDEHTDMMSELELTSGDYSREYVAEKGTMQMATGIKMIKFAANAINPILPVSGGVRTSFCMAQDAICVGMTRVWKIEVQPRNELYDTKQVVITGVLGAVRTEGKLIQKVTTTD